MPTLHTVDDHLMRSPKLLQQLCRDLIVDEVQIAELPPHCRNVVNCVDMHRLDQLRAELRAKEVVRLTH